MNLKVVNKKVYVDSDIHNDADGFKLFLKKIYFEEDDIKRQLRLAEVNHCLTLEQVSDEIIEEYGIANGDYDTVKECKYNVPTETSIGRVYQMLIVSVSSNVEIEKTIKEVFSSFISDEISNFNSNVYYSNPDYLRCSYLDGRIF